MSTDLSEAPAPAARRRALLALLLIVPVPTVSTVIVLFVFEGAAGKVIAACCKLYMLMLPLLWQVKVDRQRPRLSMPGRKGVIAGLVSGVMILAAMLIAFELLRQGIDLTPLRDKAHATGFADWRVFAGAFVYIIFVNSLLEEYVWRWFVFGKLEQLITGRWRGPVAVVGSAALFTVHHVFALAAWVDWRFNVFACLGIFLGATIWSWLYLRYRSIWPAYISHVAADVAVCVIGYQLIFG
jgi:membrane protease YdiL (CAAX protease family)